MDKMQSTAGQPARGRHPRAMRLLMAGLVVALAAGCPLPYQYSREGWAGNAGVVDPSSPGMTAGPTVTYSSSAESGTLSDTEAATTSSDTTITLQTDTPGSVIYYTTDGSTPDPRDPHTSRYVPGSPITLAIAAPTADNCSKSLAVKATAIGPNMKPSVVMCATVNVQYPQAAAPTFSPPAGPPFRTDQSVTISTTTSNAAIYYVIKSGPTQPAPSELSTPYTGPILVTGPSTTVTIWAMAVKAEMFQSRMVGVTYTVQYDGLADPIFNPSSGTFDNDTSVRIDSGSGSTIWYTLNGTTPVPGTSSSVPSGGSVPLAGGAEGTGTLTVRAIAAQTGMNNSPERTASYTFKAAKPSRSVAGGTYDNDQTVTLGTATTGAVVRYTTNGTPPTSSSPAYDGVPILVTTSASTIRSIAFRSGFADSAEQADTYILKVAPPSFSPGSGNYPGSRPVYLSDATTGSVTIYYTTDGSPPNTGSPIYGSYVTVPHIYMPSGGSTTIRTFAVKPGYQNSQEVSATYVFPALPLGIVARGTWTNSILVSWNAVPGAIGYRVLRDYAPTFPDPAVLTPTTNSVLDTGLSQSVTYYYKVIAQFSAGMGDPPVDYASSMTLPSSAVPAFQTVSAAGLEVPPAPPIAPTPPDTTVNYWKFAFGTGWIASGRTYVVWHFDYQNSANFAIASYSGGALVSYWTIGGNRYITDIGQDTITGELIFIGQYGTTLLDWYTIMP